MTSIAIACDANNMNPGERLRTYRKAAGLTADELGRRAAMVLNRDRPVSAPTVRAHENGTNTISADMADAYARVLKIKPADILFGDDGPVTVSVASVPDHVRMVGIVGEVRAGAFAEIPAEEPTPTEFVPVQLPDYTRAQLYALTVRGRSMDKDYPDGSVVVICPAHEAGIRANDHVVVRRWRGGLAETTLKEVVVENGAVVLWPRSTDPEFQTPIRLETVRDADEGPEIIGVVVGSFTARASRTGPLLAL